MTLLKELQSHRGGILRIKSELFWYNRRGWDGVPGRVCLVLDAVHAASLSAADATGTRAAAALGGWAVLLPADGAPATSPAAAALLLIDGCPQWVWVCKEDVELIT